MLNDDKIFDMYMYNQKYALEAGIGGAENMNFRYNTVDYG